MKKQQIPVLKLNVITKIENKETFDYYLGINNEDDKDQSCCLLTKESFEHKQYLVNYDFRVGAKFKKKEWSHLNYVMIYENREVTKHSRIVQGGKGSYEAILWVSAKKTNDNN